MVQLCPSGYSSISTEAARSTSSYSGDDAGALGHHPDDVTEIGDEDVAWCIDCDTSWRAQLCWCRLTSVTRIAILSVTGHSSDDALGYDTDATITSISYVDAAA
jgi:hypothetical protein